MVIKQRDNVHKTLGIILIITGVILYPTPIPGTTVLIVLGFIWFMGKNKTLSFLNKILNKKVFKLLKIRSIVKKIQNEN